MGWSRLPLENGKDDDEKHQRTYRDGKRRSKDRQQKAAKSGAHNSGKVQLNPAQLGLVFTASASAPWQKRCSHSPSSDDGSRQMQ